MGISHPLLGLQICYTVGSSPINSWEEDEHVSFKSAIKKPQNLHESLLFPAAVPTTVKSFLIPFINGGKVIVRANSANRYAREYACMDGSHCGGKGIHLIKYSEDDIPSDYDHDRFGNPKFVCIVCMNAIMDQRVADCTIVSKIPGIFKTPHHDPDSSNPHRRPVWQIWNSLRQGKPIVSYFTHNFTSQEFDAMVPIALNYYKRMSARQIESYQNLKESNDEGKYDPDEAEDLSPEEIKNSKTLLIEIVDALGIRKKGSMTCISVNKNSATVVDGGKSWPLCDPGEKHLLFEINGKKFLVANREPMGKLIHLTRIVFCNNKGTAIAQSDGAITYGGGF